MELIGNLSVVIPMHNGRKFIDRAIASVERISKTIEIIVVENGSIDGSFDYVSNKYPHIKLLILDAPSKSNARNLGAEIARNSIVTFLDQDDELLEARIQNQYLFDAMQGQIVIGTQIFDPNEFLLMPVYLQNSKNKHLPNYHPISMLISRSVFLEKGLFDPGFDLAEDFEILTRLQRKNIPIKFIAEGFVLRHFHEANESHKVKKAESELFRMLRLNIMERRKEI